MSKKHRSRKQDKRKHTRDEIVNIIKDERIKDIFNKIIEKNYSDKYSDEKSKKHVEEFYEENRSEDKKEEFSEKSSKKHRRHRRHRKEKDFTTSYDFKGKKEKCSECRDKNHKKEDSSEYEVIEVEEYIEERFKKHIEEDCTDDRYEDHHKHHKSDKSEYDCTDWKDEDDCTDDRHEEYHKHDKSEDDCTDWKEENDCTDDRCENNCDDCTDDRCENDCDDWTEENDCSDDDIIVECCEADVESETLSLCPNIPLAVTANCRTVIIKTPVVLAEPKITISMISSLKLEDAALEIKRIRKNVYLTQCKLIPNSGDGDPNFGIIFIEGFVRKNIEYATSECKAEGVVSGKIKHTTVKVPFRCTTRVRFTTQPIFTNNTPQNEVEIVQSTLNVCDPCGESIFGINPCEQSSRFMEFFNEKVFCELVDTEILESDILQKPTDSCCKSPIEQTFQDITEKVVLNITIKLLQNQQVLIR